MAARTGFPLTMGAIALVAASMALPVASAQQPAPAPPKYDGIMAGQEAYVRAEAQRHQNLATQLSANDTMAWYAGAPTTTPYPPDLESVYANYPPRAYRPGQPRLVYAHRGYPGVFEAWPMVPGDIWGYPYLRRVAQPRGTVTIPTGPNGYISRPLYDSDLAARPVAPSAPQPQPAQPAPAPPTASPTSAPPPPGLSVTALASPKPAPEAIPTPEPENQGPREF